MSYVFDYGDETVWSPALRVGELYVVLARELAEHMDVPVGLRANASDHYFIELEEFKRFVRALCDLYFSSEHVLRRSFLEGLLAVSLGMLRRCGVAFTMTGDDELGLAAKVDEALKSMPA